MVDGLQNIGHEVEEYVKGGSVVGAVSVEKGGIYAAADTRKSAQVDGY